MEILRRKICPYQLQGTFVWDICLGVRLPSGSPINQSAVKTKLQRWKRGVLGECPNGPLMRLILPHLGRHDCQR